MQKHEEQQLTPEQLKAMKGPSRDDPVEAEGAASWVQQFNEELAAPSRNALECKHVLSPCVLPQQTFRVLHESWQRERCIWISVHEDCTDQKQVLGL